MAQQTTVRFVDDLDGSDAVGTIDFALEGRVYAIDLSDSNAAKLRDALAPYIAAGRRTGGRAKRSAAASPKSSSPSGETSAVRTNRDETAAIREWARANGFPDVANRGRIPVSVLDAYAARLVKTNGRKPAAAKGGDVREGTGTAEVSFSGATAG